MTHHRLLSDFVTENCQLDVSSSLVHSLLSLISLLCTSSRVASFIGQEIKGASTVANRRVRVGLPHTIVIRLVSVNITISGLAIITLIRPDFCAEICGVKFDRARLVELPHAKPTGVTSERSRNPASFWKQRRRLSDNTLYTSRTVTSSYLPTKWSQIPPTRRTLSLPYRRNRILLVILGAVEEIDSSAPTLFMTSIVTSEPGADDTSGASQTYSLVWLCKNL